MLSTTNTFMKVIVDPLNIYHYLLKYVTKQEEASNSLHKLTEAGSKSGKKSVISKVLNLVYSLTGQRNVSNQEVACLIESNNLFETDLKFEYKSLEDSPFYEHKKLKKPGHFKQYLDRLTLIKDHQAVEVGTISGIKTKALQDISFVEFYTIFSTIKNS